LKGVAFTTLIYGDVGYKRMNDFDILIKRQDIQLVYQVHRELGHHFLAESVSSQSRTGSRSFVAPPVVTPDYACVFGTQWGIKMPRRGLEIDYDKLWSRTRAITFEGLPVRTLAPEDHLHHLCLHLGYFKLGLRDVMDIYNLLRHYRGRFDWKLFATTVAESGSYDAVCFALGIAQSVQPDPEAQAYLITVNKRGHPRLIKAAHRKTRTAEVFLNLHSDHIQTIHKAISKFDSTRYFPEKLRLYLSLWALIWWPNRSEMWHMSALVRPRPGSHIRARLTIPFSILRVIADEIGGGLLALLLLKVNVDLFLSLVKWPFARKGKDDSRAFADRLGIPYDRLTQLVNQFQ
jgi:hypothetical protein